MIVPIMGIQSKTPTPPPAPTGLAGALFTPVQQRVLGLLFGQPQRRFQSAELIRLASSGTGSVHRLLTKLATVGLITTHRVGNQKHYQANAESPVFAELTGLIRKTVGLVTPLQVALAPLATKITAAFVYGSIAKGKDRADSDIDLMIIADTLEYGEVYAALMAAEASLGRPINPNVMSRAEWQHKRRGPDTFSGRIAAQSRVFVIGSDDVLG